jgi:asparagine synthetase B (glutamine-hydrolysing)
MCGHAGFFRAFAQQGLAQTVRVMANAIVHRSPDDVGAWADGNPPLKVIGEN